MFNSKTYVDRRNRLVESMPEEFAIILPPSTWKPTSADGHYPYTPNLNLLYLTGIEQPRTWLVVHRRKGVDLREDIFIDAYDETYAKWVGSVLTKEEAKEISGVENIGFNEGARKWIDRILLRWGIDNVWVDYPLSGLTEEKGSRLVFAGELLAAYPHLNFHRLSDQVFRMRMVKDADEVEMMNQAVKLTCKGFLRALAALKPGMLEYEFEAELLYEFLKSGERFPAFPAIVAGGGRATCLHYADNDQPLEEGTLLLVDFGAKKGPYNADITRTIPVSGKYSERQRELMELVLEVQSEAIRLLIPGKIHAQWNREVKEFYTQLLLQKGIIEKEEEIEKYYYHNIGHHIGMDTHDENILSDQFKPGMILTVEPGFYSEEEGIGIRIEDDVLIGETGNTILSADIPKRPEEIEEFMAGEKRS